MVKPQPKIRPEYVADPADAAPRPSLDSYHCPVTPRRIKGGKYPVRIPDFIVVKATGSSTEDRILLVVEVKPHDVDEDIALDQLVDYMDSLANKTHQDTNTPPFTGNLHGLLVIGSSVKHVTLSVNGRGIAEKLKPFTGHLLHTFLHSIVKRNW